MAFYNVNLKPVVESAVQDPDNTGVDLDQVEKDIVGPDGIEAHRDDVEAAEEGLAGDPLEEAYNIMYEAEYNYNQIMRCIGMQEISEAAMGRELVLEAADIKGFFAKVKEFFVTMFKRITETVKTVLAKLDFQAKADKKFVTENRKKIEFGASKGKWEFEGYTFEELGISKMIDNANTEAAKAAFDQLDKLSAAPDSEAASEIVAKMLDKSGNESDLELAIKGITGFDCDNLSDLAKKLIEKLRGEKKKITDGGMGKEVCDILAGDRETAKIREQYKNVKASFAHDMKVLADMESKVAKDEKYATLKLRVCSDAVKTIKAEKNVMNTVYGVHMKLARAKRAQARTMAHFFLNTYEKTVKNPEVQHNSAGIFGSLKMI